MPSASSLKEFLVTLLLATYLPVPFYLLWLHGFYGRWRRIGLSSFAIHIPIYLVMVAAVVYFHSIWSAGAWAWPTALSFLSIIPLGVSVFLAIYTYATIDRRVLHLFQQIRPRGERRLITTGILGCIRHPRYLMFSLGAAGNVLLTGYPLVALAGVVTVPRGQAAILRQIEFLPVSDNRVLAILVINDREVQNRILHTEKPHTSDELQKAANFINDNYVGSDLLQIREGLIDDLDRTRDSMNQAMHDIISVAQSAMEGAAESKDEFLVSGERNLMDFAELSDIETLRGLFDAFSRKRFMLKLLDQSINASGVQVFIGRESGYQILDNCSVVTAPYRVDDNNIGVLGVIGPTRMAYDRVVPIVDVTARLLESALKP